MPIFCYRCVKCNHRFEVLIQTGHQEPQECPQCKGAVRKEYAPFAIGTGGESSASSGGGCAGCSANSCASCRH